MITKLRIENFKCLRDVTVELQPLTVLIGKNDTGKTSLLEALGMLGEMVNSFGPRSWEGQGIDNLIRRGATERLIRWQATVAPSPRIPLPGQATYDLTVGVVRNSLRVREERLTIEGVESAIEREPQNGTLRRVLTENGNKYSEGEGAAGWTMLSIVSGLHGFPSSIALKEALATTPPYRFDPNLLTIGAVFNPTKEIPEEIPKLGSTGGGLPAVLDFLLGTRRKIFDQIERELCEAVPQVKAIQVKPATGSDRPGAKSISFELAGGHDIPASMASDGVLFLLAYLTLIHAPGAPAVIRLEEPENGIHPRQLERVAQYLKRLTDPSRGANAAQILVATHSPYFLDFVPPESVIVFGRRENGETVTAPILTLPGVKERIASGFSLGEMWFNVGEDELLKDLLQ
jgi:predicted ATPase